jgi:hypothetical protein
MPPGSQASHPLCHREGDQQPEPILQERSSAKVLLGHPLGTSQADTESQRRVRTKSHLPILIRPVDLHRKNRIVLEIRAFTMKILCCDWFKTREQYLAKPVNSHQL